MLKPIRSFTLLLDELNPHDIMPFGESFIVAHYEDIEPRVVGSVRFVNMADHIYGASITIGGKHLATMPHINNGQILRYLSDISVLEYINDMLSRDAKPVEW